MATPNFAIPTNASKYFVVLTKREETIKKCKDCNAKHYQWEFDLSDINHCEECESDNIEETTEYVQPQDWEYNDLIQNIKNEITKLKDGYEDDTQFFDRNYQRTTLGKLEVSKWYGDVEISLRLTAFIQSAYYDGATLDYLVEVYNGYEYTEEPYEDIIKDFLRDNSEMSIGMQKIQTKNILNWLEITIKNLSQELEKIYDNFAQHKLQCNGVFGNGEAIYSEIKD